MTRKEFAERAANRPPFILDGATGSNLMKAGMGGGVCPEKWILENPAVLEGLQRRYIEAGAEAVTAPTFGGGRTALKRYGLDGEIERINRELVALSKSAADGKALVAADISPTGLFLRPFGDAGFDDMYSVFEEHARILDSAGADLFIIETQMNLAEARIALLAVRAVCEKPVIVTMTADAKGLTMSGNPAGVCALILSSLGADAVGLNCSVGPDKMNEILRGCTDMSYSPLAAKANAGNPHGEGADMSFDVGSAEFAAACAEMMKNQVRVIGGCCGTDPDYIRGINLQLRGIEPPAYKTPDLQKLDRLAANERRVFDLGAGLQLPEPIICSDSLEDDIYEALEDCPECLRIYVGSESDADLLCEAAPALTLPLVLGGESPDAVAAALKKYPGRAALDPGISNIPAFFDSVQKYNPVGNCLIKG